jgi:hypothetical protein
MTLSDHDWRKLRAQTEASLTRQQRWADRARPRRASVALPPAADELLDVA